MRYHSLYAFCVGVLLSSSPAFSGSVWTYGVTQESGWSDFNKSWNGDTYLCWAASASNLINWWQENSSYASCANNGTPTGENIFRTYVNSFQDLGGAAQYAWEWWYEGSYLPYDFGLDEYGYFMPHTLDPSTWGGGYYNPKLYQQNIYYWNDMTAETSSSLPSGYDTFSAYCSDFIVSSLNSCYGVSLGISANDAMGHAITLWGVDRDDGTGLLTKIYFTDSDDDTTALRSCSLTEKNGYLHMDGYHSTLDYYIDSAYGLNLIEAVPEPASFSLLLAGGSLLFLRRKRRLRL
ncbi:MAG: PEP-CTERM sorting domain-containing protein [Akkermansia muciniphila]|uniref:PEP-CTERM sorting domain-containing protein n=1 Tax=uncultured Akkermansia sp. TaxID=512294 RepID=UPI0026041ED4|nr:PEP-CTERM sorting domain-containing protein [uncultured Akkermansia sp.]